MKILWLLSCVLHKLAYTRSESPRPKEQMKPEAGAGQRDGVAAENRVKCETRGLCTQATDRPNNTQRVPGTHRGWIKPKESKENSLIVPKIFCIYCTLLQQPV